MNRNHKGPSSDPKNRRTHDRWCVDLPCRFRVDGTISNGRLLDLSVGGAFVESSECPEDRRPIELVWELEDKQVRLEGVVRHTGWFLVGFHNGTGFGIQFDHMPPQVESFLNKALSTAPPSVESKFKLER